MVKGGSEDLVYRQRIEIPFDETVVIYKASTFIGLDRGDVVEADVELEAVGGFRFYQRSFHKEWLVSYEAWLTKAISVTTDRVTVVLLCRVNGTQQNSEHPRYKQGSARFHAGVVLEVGPAGGQPSQPPPPGPDPEARNYYELWETLKSKQFNHTPCFNCTWEVGIKQALDVMIWDGDRHLTTALACPAVFPWDGNLAAEDAQRAIAASRANSAALLDWIERLKQPNRQGFEGRSMVRKENFDSYWSNIIEPHLALCGRFSGIGGRSQELCQ
jgi:hypothetical protein